MDDSSHTKISPDKEPVNKENAREHLANERTLLAWIRTSIGIMAFGFVVVKFSLFIKQISLLLDKQVPVTPQHGYSSLIGIMLVAVGALILILAYLKYKQTEQQLKEQAFRSSSTLVSWLTLVILIISILLIIYLVKYTSRYQ